MKVLGICGSPRRNGNTEILLENLLAGAEIAGATTELILIRDKKIEFCDGCLSCEKTGKCHISDDMQDIYPKIVNSDVIVFGSPVYWNNVTPHTKNFIDRINPIASKLKGKSLAFVLVGQCKDEEKDESQKHVIDWFKELCNLYEAKFVGVVSSSARMPGEIKNCGDFLREAKELGERIAQKA